MSEAPMRVSRNGLVVDGDGWFVVNARESRWKADGMEGRIHDEVMDRSEGLLPTLIEAGYAATDEVGSRWWFADAGIARVDALNRDSGE